MRSLLCLAALTAILTPGPATSADSTVCEAQDVTVTAPDTGLVRRTCQAANRAKEFLGTCNIRVNSPIQINVIQSLGENCFGVYHCDTGVIDVLTPRAASDLRRQDSPFADVPEMDFFDSLIVHELAHAAFDDVPCPFGTCQTTAEYVAYTMQVMSLPPAARDTFETRIKPGRTVSWDEINLMILLMAPKLFVQKAWVHLSQRDDPCGFIGQIMQGDIRFDVEPH